MIKYFLALIVAAELATFFVPAAILRQADDIKTESAKISEETAQIKRRIEDLNNAARSLDDAIVVESALCSYYADSFNGKQMANGKIFDQCRRYVAHKSLPFNTPVFFIDDDGSTAYGTITDRGPYIEPRKFDLSTSLAFKVGLRKTGVKRLTVVVLHPYKYAVVPNPSRSRHKRRGAGIGLAPLSLEKRGSQ